MSGLIATLLAFYVGLQVSAALLPPRKLLLTSENFKHVLTWEGPPNEPPVYYRVECSCQMQPWKTVEDCSNLTTRRCDLTKYLTNISFNYRVRAFSFTAHNSSEAPIAVHLTPMQDTILGPPIVDIVESDRYIRVTIQPPVTPLWSKEKQQYVSIFKAYSVLHYKIQLMHMEEEVFSSAISTTMENYTFNKSSLFPNGNYCVSVTMNASGNIKPSVPSEPKCVVTEYHVTGSYTFIIVPILGCLLSVSLVLFLLGLDRAGYICRAKTLIPKVLKSMPTSESKFIGGCEYVSPTLSIPVDIISQKFEVEQKPQIDDKKVEGGYASRKRLQESDTSGTATSGEFASAVSSSVGSSRQANSSAEEDLSAGHRGDEVPSTIVHLPGSTAEDSANLPFDTSGVFNINLNTVSIRDPAEVRTGFGKVEVPPEEAEDSIESHEAGIALDQHNDLCIDVDGLEVDYCSDYEEEEDVSENDDSDSHLISGYMKR